LTHPIPTSTTTTTHVKSVDEYLTPPGENKYMFHGLTTNEIHTTHNRDSINAGIRGATPVNWGHSPTISALHKHPIHTPSNKTSHASQPM
jgi:hypothetical protein